MILKKNNLFLNLFKYLIIFIFTIIVLESFTRIFFFIILKEKNVIKYGFNDDLEIHTLDLSKFEISIFDILIFNQLTLCWQVLEGPGTRA